MALLARDTEREEAKRLLAEALNEIDVVKRTAQEEKAWELEAAAAEAMAELEAQKQMALEEKSQALESASQELLTAVGVLLQESSKTTDAKLSALERVRHSV